MTSLPPRTRPVGSVFEYNSSEEVAVGSEAEDVSDVDSSVVEDPADDISTTENKVSTEECQDSINEGKPEASIVEEAEDISNTEDNGDIEAVTTEDEGINAKYQDVPADSDTSMDLADVVAVDQESTEATKDATRFVCSFGCGKSYSAKCNLSNHEIKVHNRPKLKNRKSQKPTASLKEHEEEEEKKEGETTMETNKVSTDDGIIGNSETGVQDAEEAKVGGVEEEINADKKANKGEEEEEAVPSKEAILEKL